MPALLRELHGLIPSYGNQFFWTDEKGELSNLYGEVPEIAGIAPFYIQEFYNRRDFETNDNVPQIVRREYGALTKEQTLRIRMREFYRSDAYNLVFRPLGYHDAVRLVIREGQRPLGLICLFRGRQDPPFTARDARLLESLEPFIAHALTAQPEPDIQLVESGESAMIVADADGRPLYLSPEARRLLFLAAHPRMSPGKTTGEAAVLPPALVRMCRNLVAVYADDASASVPLHRHTNPWGGFTFRAYRLDGAATSPCLIGISVSRQEPLPVKLMRQMEHLPLTKRQAEVCLLMASGLSYAQIAQRLDISPNTAITHSRWIYNTLNVSNRAELVNKLLSL